MPLAGKYRLVDIPISNCLNSGPQAHLPADPVQQLVAASARAAGLPLRRILARLRRDHGRAADAGDNTWYQGTADAVRQNLTHFDNSPHKYVLVLSGDQLYRMNFRHLISEHIKSGADVTVATIPVRRSDARGLRHPGNRRRGAHHPLRGKAEGPGAARHAAGQGAGALAPEQSRAARTSSSPRWASTSSTATCWPRRSPASRSISASTSSPT